MEHLLKGISIQPMEDMCSSCAYNGIATVTTEEDSKLEQVAEMTVNNSSNITNTHQDALSKSTDIEDNDKTVYQTPTLQGTPSFDGYKEIVHVPIQTHGGYQNEFIFCGR